MFALFTIIFLLASLAATAVVIRNHVIQMEVNAWRRIPPVVSIATNSLAWENNQELNAANTALDPKFIEELKVLPEVKDVYFTTSSSWYTRFKHSEREGMPNFLTPSGINRFTHQLLGISSKYPLPYQLGMAELSDGRFFTDAEMDGSNILKRTPALITQSFANENALGIGSIMTLYDLTTDFVFEGSVDPLGELRVEAILPELNFELEVVGILDLGIVDYSMPIDPLIVTSEYVAGHWWSANTIYVPLWFNESAHQFLLDYYQDRVSDDVLTRFGVIQSALLILLYDSLELQIFQEAAGHLLPEYLDFIDMSESNQLAFSTMDQFILIADWIFAGTLIGSVIILILLMLWLVKARQKEFGIYLALGESKLKIILSLFGEIFPLVVFAVPLAGLLTNMLAVFLMNAYIIITLRQLEPPASYSAFDSIVGQSGLAPQVISSADFIELSSLSSGSSMVLILSFMIFGIIGIAVIISTLFLVKMKVVDILRD